MSTPSTIIEWLATAPGVAMNPDGHYGLQCVDLADQYAQDIFGVPWNQSLGGVTGAKQLLDAAPDAYWIRTDNDPNNPNLIPSQGDVVVFGGSAINQWGHVAVCDSADANGMWVIQQDGFAAPLIWADGNWYSNKPAHRAWLAYYSNGTGMLAGWLTPRTNKLAQQDAPPAQPVAPAPTSGRTTGSSAVNFRKAPNTSGGLIDTLAPDTFYPSFTKYTHGGEIDGNDVWFKGTIRGGWAWSGAFTDSSAAGLEYEAFTPAAPVPTPQPVPAPAPAPAPVKYTFAPAFDFVEVIPAGEGNFQHGNFPADPGTAVIHQFGTPGVDTLSSVINTFSNPDGGCVASAHFVVSGSRIIQMVSLSDRAYHAGSVGNNYVGIETDPAQDSATIASTRKLLAALNAKYGHALSLTRHKDVPGNSTSCGTLIDLEKYKEATVPTPVPAAPVVDKEAVIKDFLNWQLSQYMKYSK